MKRERMLILLLTLLLMLTACGKTEDPAAQPGALPGRMVQKIEVAIHPEDEAYAKTYTDKDQMSPLLRVLRDMDTSKHPEEEPSLSDGQTYYTVTATYANGSSRIYYLLSHKYLRIDDGPWYIIDSNDAMELVQLIRGDEEPVSTDPSEETLPEETEEQTDPAASE